MLEPLATAPKDRTHRKDAMTKATDNDIEWMSEKEAQAKGISTAPAFCQIMSLRDYFAGQALAGMTAKPGRFGKGEELANEVYRVADAMMKARGDA